LVGAASTPQAGPPFVTDDPEFASGGRMKNQCPVRLEAHTGPGRTELNAPLFDLNYGFPNVLAFRPEQYFL
jgi:hypothetical protein